MNDFDIIQVLSFHHKFTIFEAYSKSLQFLVVVKKCVYSKNEEAGFFIRSALIKAKECVYS